MTDHNDGAKSFRERMLCEAHEWVRTNVPKHTRAEYEALLATNTDLAIELIAKWRDLEDLRARYHELQYETTKQTAPLPPMITKASVNRMVYDMATEASVTWEINPYEMRFRVSDRDRLDRAAPCIIDAFKQYFHDKYVPELWAHTEATLFHTFTRTTFLIHSFSVCGAQSIIDQRLS